MKHPWRDLHRKLTAAGFEHVVNGRGHHRYTKPGCPPVTMSASPSDWRARVKAEADVRRALRDG